MGWMKLEKKKGLSRFLDWDRAIAGMAAKVVGLPNDHRTAAAATTTSTSSYLPYLVNLYSSLNS